MEFVELIKTPTVDNVILHQPGKEPVDGTLCITGHYLILSSRKSNAEELLLLHMNVDVVERKITSSPSHPSILSMGGGTLTLKCKNLMILQLHLPTVDECNNVADSIEMLGNLADVQLWYPFFYQPRQYQITDNGWHAFTLDVEFSHLLNAANTTWRLSRVNRDYTVCESYPSSVIVPKSISDEQLAESAAFRQLGRFPILSYYHRENGVALLTSSQPLVGNSNKRCKSDEQLVNATLGVGKRGYIIDTRAMNVAQVIKSRGGGYEVDAHYSQWRRVHKSVERYHHLLDNCSKLIEACSSPNLSSDKWLGKLESSNWLSNVSDLLNCACLVAQCLHQDGCSVLVHGSDGTDSTLQVSSLAQLILSGDCRTVRGFEALVQRVWVDGGHPFRSRCARGAHSANSGGGVMRTQDEAPVFLLFLDAVYQIYLQFPCSFEFNEKMLVTLFEHAYASSFGTFLCNCDKEKVDNKVKESTVSLWSYINRVEMISEFINPLYEPNNQVIWPSVAPQSLELWRSLYMRECADWQPVLTAHARTARIKEHEKELHLRVNRLRRHLDDLEREALKAGVIACSVPGEGMAEQQPQ